MEAVAPLYISVQGSLASTMVAALYSEAIRSLQQLLFKHHKTSGSNLVVFNHSPNKHIPSAQRLRVYGWGVGAPYIFPCKPSLCIETEAKIEKELEEIQSTFQPFEMPKTMMHI